MLLLAANEKRLSITPPTPAIAAERAKIRILVRLARIPDASAAVSELRTASMALPDADRKSAWISPVMTPKTQRNSRI